CIALHTRHAGSPSASNSNASGACSAGAYGLDYAALPVVEARCGAALDSGLFDALQAMEREALRLMSGKGG
ncbi:hypothetical protein, partial [Chromobacterium piscinae]|uniref:hypothetical protein n=1 Tax=Chromobacterium piscinae TaxID=686831 RepID=UPI00326199C5